MIFMFDTCIGAARYTCNICAVGEMQCYSTQNGHDSISSLYKIKCQATTKI